MAEATNHDPRLAVEIAGIRFNNPVIGASGTFGYGLEFAELIDLNRLGGFATKGLSARPLPGNPPPRIVETHGGMLNAIGLQNVGVETFLREKLSYLSRLGPPVIVNITGESIEEYVELAKRVSDQEGVSGIELNISCPNVADGLIFGCNAVLANKLVVRVRQATLLPLIPKLSPNVTDVAEIARALAEGGADALSLINTLIGMAIDVQPGYVRISEVVHLQNGTSQTFLGNIAFPLPRGARFITFHEGLHRPAVQGDRITDRLIVRPGSHQAAYAYTLAGEGEIVLDRQIPLPVERLELFATAPAEVRSPRLEPAPTVTEEGRTYTRASGRSVPAGLLPMTIAGVPAVRLWPAPAAAGTLAALLVVGLGWAVLASGREEATRRGG